MENIGTIFYFQWELKFLHWLQTIHNPILDTIMKGITGIGDGSIWLIIILLFFILPINRKSAINAFLSLLIAYLICNCFLKGFFFRCRPCWLEPTVELLVKAPKSFSFPSGHTNAAFAVALGFFARSKKIGIPMVILAAAIAFSRMYLFVHWPTDILGGIVSGAFGAVVSYFIINGIYKVIDRIKQNTIKMA